MTVEPGPTLSSWLRHAGLSDGVTTMVFSSAQEAMLPYLRKQASGFKHYNAEEKEAWALWTAFTHVSHRVDMAKTAAPVVYLPPPDAKPLLWYEKPTTLLIGVGVSLIFTMLEIAFQLAHGK